MYISTHSCYLCSTFIIQFFKVQINLEYVQASFLKKWFCFVAKLNRRECFDQLLSGSCQLPELLHIALQKVTTSLFFSKLVYFYLTFFFFKYSFWDNVLLFCIHHQYSSTITVLCDLTHQYVCGAHQLTGRNLLFRVQKTVGVHST